MSERSQNKDYLNSFLARLLPGVPISEEGKNRFLDRCDEEKVWLPGLSPLVRERFIAFTHETFKTFKRSESIIDISDRIFDDLSSQLEAENVLLRQELSRNSVAVARHSGGHESHSKADLLAQLHINGGRNYGWLGETDVFNAFAFLNQQAGVYVHDPVAQANNEFVSARVRGAFDEGAEIVFIPQVSGNGNHWTLRYYTGDDKGRLFDPSGAGGKCGDRIIAKAYQEVQQRLGTDLGVTVTAEQGSSNELREQTIRLIRRSHPESSIHSPTSEPNPGIRREPSVLADLYDQWNVAIDGFLQYQEGRSADDVGRAKAWDTFVGPGSSRFSLFAPVPHCSAEAVQHDEANAPRLV